MRGRGCRPGISCRGSLPPVNHDARGSAQNRTEGARPMRISGPNVNGAVAASAMARRSTSPMFTVDGSESARGSGTTTALRNVGSIEALIALQGLEEAGERRKRAVKRGRVALDALDDLKIALLGGSLSRAMVS